MTANRDLKNIIRSRMAKTGESYSAARAQVVRDRQKDGEPVAAAVPATVEVAVIKVNQSSARVRRLDDAGDPITLRCGGASELIPGQVASVRFDRCWSHSGQP